MCTDTENDNRTGVKTGSETGALTGTGRVLSGARIVVETLLLHGVRRVFGYPGGSVLPIYDALGECGEIEHLLTASEAGAAHAADGYTRSGGVGVCISTSGPGATNLVTGIATAFMDSSPVVFITGNVPGGLIGTDSFQEIDITGITLPVTKYNVMVTDVRELERELRRAFYIARKGRPGPVLVDIPRDVQEACTEFRGGAPERPEPMQPDEARLEHAARLIDGAARPVILTGGGARGAQREVAALMDRLGCPAVSTVMGLGVVPSTHPGYAGMCGVHGTRAANRLLRTSDLVIAAGVRFSDRSVRPGEDRLRVLHIDTDRSEINKNVLSRYYVVGDAALTLGGLAERVTPREAGYTAARPAAGRKGRPERAIALACEVLKDAVSAVVTDVGQHQVWTAQNWRFDRPGELVTPGGLGTMGFGMGAAIGTALATGGRVLLITGDGSFMMNCVELATAVRLGLPIAVLLMDNGTLGMVRQQQRALESGRVYATTLGGNVSYTALARAFGADAVSARSMKGLRRALERAAECAAPLLIDCRIGIDDSVREVRI